MRGGCHGYSFSLVLCAGAAAARQLPLQKPQPYQRLQSPLSEGGLLLPWVDGLCPDCCLQSPVCETCSEQQSRPFLVGLRRPRAWPPPSPLAAHERGLGCHGCSFSLHSSRGSWRGLRPEQWCRLRSRFLRLCRVGVLVRLQNKVRNYLLGPLGTVLRCYLHYCSNRCGC